MSLERVPLLCSLGTFMTKLQGEDPIVIGFRKKMEKSDEINISYF